MNGQGPPASALRAVVDTLVTGGVRDVVICPGSRSTPLALALAATPALRTWVHLDERVGAYFALGAARATGRPAAILATSGTAVVNFAPAVTEARYGRVPLILLTADRPGELHGVGAPQAIDQAQLYGRHAKWYVELPVPGSSHELVEVTRRDVARALAAAVSAPAGPVQVNLPYREPLLPEGDLRPATTGQSSAATIPRAAGQAAGAAGLDVADAAARLREARRPLIVCGPLHAAALPAGPADSLAVHVTRLAARLGAPVVADGLSGLRCGPHDRSAVISHADLLTRLAVADGLQPDLVLLIGARPTSKALGLWLERAAAPSIAVDDGGGWERPAAELQVSADPGTFAAQLRAALPPTPSAEPGWLGRWQALDGAAAAAIDVWLSELDEPFEGVPFAQLEQALPPGALLVVGNSMPVRDLDAIMPSRGIEVRVMGNRGANGIDGLLSTALGASAAAGAPVVAVVGDLSFLHDLGALVAAHRLHLDLTVVLIDNDGGGIFSFLPQARADAPGSGLPGRYEELFGTPHGLDLGAITRVFGATFQSASRATLASLVRESTETGGCRVVGLRTERRRNVELHRSLLAAVERALEVAA